MPKYKVLVIDDDKTLLALLLEHLQEAGYEVVTADNGKDGLEFAGQVAPHLVVLDVMMPKMDGWTVCQNLREASGVPIIMLTAKGEEIDKLRGFRLGVDDYVTKPFSFAELTARVGAVLQRAHGQNAVAKVIRSGKLEIDLDAQYVLRGGEKIDLTPTEYRLLATLVSIPGRTVPTEVILHKVWGEEYLGEPEHVKHYIWSLRKKLEQDPGAPQHILTERGFGYRFE